MINILYDLLCKFYNVVEINYGGFGDPCSRELHRPATVVLNITVLLLSTSLG